MDNRSLDEVRQRLDATREGAEAWVRHELQKIEGKATYQAALWDERAKAARRMIQLPY